MDSILLSVQDLAVYFQLDGRLSRAVDGVSFDINKGETVCLVGESGCGKTVSALAVLGLIQQPPGRIMRGRILFNGEDLLDLDDEQMQEIRGNHISMVFQEPMTSLNPVFTIGDQIKEAVLVHERLEQRQLKQRCIQVLKDVGISSPEERLNDYPHQLSGGQRQRAMIAMSLACNPDLVIADEPTTALDVTIQAQILKLFEELQRRRDMSLLYISHDLGVVANIAERIYVMYAGIIVEQGRARDIFRQPCHPYTQALLASLPNPKKRGGVLHSIPGTVPDPAYKPAGCPFHPRCSIAIDACRHHFPDMYDCGSGHMGRCPVLYQKRATTG